MLSRRLLCGAQYSACYRFHGETVLSVHLRVLPSATVETHQLAEAGPLEFLCNSVFSKKYPNSLVSLQGKDSAERTPQYVKDFQLAEWGHQALFYEYLEMVIQVV